MELTVDLYTPPYPMLLHQSGLPFLVILPAFQATDSQNGGFPLPAGTMPTPPFIEPDPQPVKAFFAPTRSSGPHLVRVRPDNNHRYQILIPNRAFHRRWHSQSSFRRESITRTSHQTPPWLRPAPPEPYLAPV